MDLLAVRRDCVSTRHQAQPRRNGQADAADRAPSGRTRRGGSSSPAEATESRAEPAIRRLQERSRAASRHPASRSIDFLSAAADSPAGATRSPAEQPDPRRSKQIPGRATRSSAEQTDSRWKQAAPRPEQTDPRPSNQIPGRATRSPAEQPDPHPSDNSPRARRRIRINSPSLVFQRAFSPSIQTSRSSAAPRLRPPRSSSARRVRAPLSSTRCSARGTQDPSAALIHDLESRVQGLAHVMHLRPRDRVINPGCSTP